MTRPSSDTSPPQRAAAPRGASRLQLALVGVWLAAICVAMAILVRVDAAAGDPARPPSSWPAQSALPHRAGRPTLAVFLHPQCPCSIATIAELERLLARRHDRADVVLAFIAPSNASAAWSRTSARVRAEAVCGATVVDDVDGAEARRFRATTSGATFLYDANGGLRFEGGITESRGHEGECSSQDALGALLDDVAAGSAAAPVFGCPLFAPGSQSGPAEPGR